LQTLLLGSVCAICLASTYSSAQQNPIPSQNTLVRGYFNIFASFNENSVNLGQSILAVIKRLGQCGIEAESDATYEYENMTLGLVIIVTGPFRTSSEARAQLLSANRCGFNGYTKWSMRREGHLGE
jgi:hypothetical protein